MFKDRQLNFLIFANIAVVIAAVVLVGDTFIGLFNLQSMSSQVPELGFLALGVAIAMIAGNGGIDLSGIALANLSGVVAYMLAPFIADPNEAQLLYAWAFAGIALCTGVFGGLINGGLIAFAGLTPIIATLGTQLLFTGLAVGISGGSSLSLGYIEPLDNFGNSPVLGVPLCFSLFLIIALGLAGVMRFSPFGIKLYLLGSNAKAAFYAGIQSKQMIFITYMAASILASIAGIVIAARTSSVKSDYGSSYVLIAILITVMAGVKPEGGYGRILSVVLSATALQMLSSLFNFMAISNFFRDCAWGLLLLLFLWVSGFNPVSYFKIVTEKNKRVGAT